MIGRDDRSCGTFESIGIRPLVPLHQGVNNIQALHRDGLGLTWSFQKSHIPCSMTTAYGWYASHEPRIWLHASEVAQNTVPNDEVEHMLRSLSALQPRAFKQFGDSQGLYAKPQALATKTSGLGLRNLMPWPVPH